MEQALANAHRILLGDNPWSFLLEVLIRSAIIYVLLFVTMRLMGRRMAAQLSVSELAVMLTLGAAVGVPLQTAEQGLLPATVLLGCALLFQRGLSTWSARRRSIEVHVQGDVTLLLVDGCLLMDSLKASRLTPARVFSALRAQGVRQLGELRRVYLESTGDFSIVRYRRPRYGLRLMPPVTSPFEVRPDFVGHLACCQCGHTYEHLTGAPTQRCACCDGVDWTFAVVLDRLAEVHDHDGSEKRVQ
jgi:uncharacterized membrane protein YcaP (DUF421 family)